MKVDDEAVIITHANDHCWRKFPRFRNEHSRHFFFSQKFAFKNFLKVKKKDFHLPLGFV